MTIYLLCCVYVYVGTLRVGSIRNQMSCLYLIVVCSACGLYSIKIYLKATIEAER